MQWHYEKPLGGMHSDDKISSTVFDIGPVKVNRFQVWVWKPGKSSIIFGLETGIFKPVFCFQFSIQNFRFGSVLVNYYWEIWIQFWCCLPTDLCFYQSAIAKCWEELKPRLYSRLLLGSKPGKISGFQTQNFKPKIGHFWFTLTGPV